MKALTLLFCSFFIANAWAQQVISGQVMDKQGSPLLGVNVYLEGTYDGATTDLEGRFSFTSPEQDSLVLIASSVGYRPMTLFLDGATDQLAIHLIETINRLDAVAITTGSFSGSEEGHREILKPLDIVTTAGATADIPGALNTLPGTQAVGESGRLFVRGGDGRETKTFIDGMLVHDEYSPAAPNTPSRSRFSPFMFKGTSFSTGGYSAEYGQALSSALILTSKDVAENDRTDISLMTVGADISTTQSLKNGSLAAKAQYTNLTPYFTLLRQRLDWDQAPEEWNGNFTYRWRTGKTGMLKVFSNLSTSNLALYEPDIANPEVQVPVGVSNDYAYLNTSYRDVINEKWGLRTGASFTRSHDEASRAASSLQRDLTGFHTKMAADYNHSDRLALILGGEVIGTSLRQTLSEGGQLKQSFDEHLAASFVETEWYASSSLAFKAGLRAEYSSLSQQATWSPRLSAAYKTGDHSQVSVAYGQFYQGASRQVQLTMPQAVHEQADHYLANYQWEQEGRTFRIEAYEKRYAGLARYGDILDHNTFQFDGEGHARGIDLFWRDSKTFKNTDYWVSYSFLDTRRRHQDFPGAFAPPFASAHNFSLVTKQFINEIKSQIGWTYSFASPRSYHDPNEQAFMAGRTPWYHDLSFNISYLFNSQVILHAMVNNVLGINNIFGYEYVATPNEEGFYAGRPIMPPARRFIFVGVFITLSKNKSINQLPNL
ncbi:MAG: TonB-dependent receptor [Bacteroidota bacterium]